METHSLYVYCAFLTKGSVYASERSALYRRGQAISWHSYSKMGVSCLQQHVWISPPRGSTQGHHIPPPPGCHRQSGHFIPVFQLLFRIFSLWMPTSETRCPAHPAHLRLKYTAILPQPRGGRPIGVLTRQEGRLQVKRTGPSLVLRVSGSCCCLGLKLRLEPLVHFQTGSSLRQAPPTSNAPVGHSY